MRHTQVNQCSQQSTIPTHQSTVSCCNQSCHVLLPLGWLSSLQVQNMHPSSPRVIPDRFCPPPWTASMASRLLARVGIVEAMNIFRTTSISGTVKTWCVLDTDMIRAFSQGPRSKLGKELYDGMLQFKANADLIKTIYT